jgi:histone-lysine N-methyltransferase SETD2
LNALPAGWFTAQDAKGNTYYYSKSGATTWVKPYLPAPEPPPPPKAPPKSVQTAKALQDIIDSITKPDPKTPLQSTPTGTSTPKDAKKPVEKWRSLTLEKQMKLYENTVSQTPQSTSTILPLSAMRFKANLILRSSSLTSAM